MKKVCRTAFAGCLFATLAASVFAESGSDDLLSAKLDNAVTQLMHKEKIPGTSLAVIRDGKVIKATGYGLANVELNRSRSFNLDRWGDSSRQPQ